LQLVSKPVIYCNAALLISLAIAIVFRRVSIKANHERKEKGSMYKHQDNKYYDYQTLSI